GITSKVTSDCLVDCLGRWWDVVYDRFAHLTTLVINLDNGPENHSRRTQFMQRMVDFAHHTGLTVRLAYYPPYHSKYNPIERCWGILERSYWIPGSWHVRMMYTDDLSCCDPSQESNRAGQHQESRR